MSELRIMATTCKKKAAVISVTETWLDSSVSDAEIRLEGYSVLRKDRKRTGGGVCIYINNDYAFNTRTDLTSNDTEAIWAELLLPKSKPILIGTVYRPPNQKDFVDKFQETMNKLEPEQETVILGDFNFCLLNKKSNNPIVNNFTNIMQLFNFSQVINVPTRVTQISSSLINLILVNRQENIIGSGVLDIG